MNKTTKLTLEELIRRKEQMLAAKKKPATKELYIESLGGSITIAEPNRSTIIDAQGMEDATESDSYLLLQIVTEPNLKQLAKEYGCQVPTDIIDIIFKPGEVGAVVQEGLRLAGYADNSVKAVEEIKN